MKARQLSARTQRLTKELKAAGETRIGFFYSEVGVLQKVLHPDEHIEAVVYGKVTSGFAMLVATDSRVIFIDKKPLFTKLDELTFDIVGGVNFNRSLMLAELTLHTRIGDYKLKTFNVAAAENFRNYIEQRCVEHSYAPEKYVNFMPPARLRLNSLR